MPNSKAGRPKKSVSIPKVVFHIKEFADTLKKIGGNATNWSCTKEWLVFYKTYFNTSHAKLKHARAFYNFYKKHQSTLTSCAMSPRLAEEIETPQNINHDLDADASCIPNKSPARDSPYPNSITSFSSPSLEANVSPIKLDLSGNPPRVTRDSLMSEGYRKRKDMYTSAIFPKLRKIQNSTIILNNENVNLRTPANMLESTPIQTDVKISHESDGISYLPIDNDRNNLIKSARESESDDKDTDAIKNCEKFSVPQNHRIEINSSTWKTLFRKQKIKKTLSRLVQRHCQGTGECISVLCN